MAIAPTGAIYKALEFDNVSSRTYGVYITGEAVYNAPERNVEMITIPGRNGSFALDNGRFQNIEVSYPAGIFADTEADFRQAISDFRNFLCSRKGYVRLTDEYNPNEYRMAVYKSGLEVDPAMLKAGEFKITFDCKPQRWLTSGEVPVTIGEWSEYETESGDIVEIEATETDAVKSLVADIEPIQSGSGTPSPDNVRPISGHTDVVVSRTGKNLLPPQQISGTISSVTISNNDGVYTLSGNASAYAQFISATSFLLKKGTYTLFGNKSASDAQTTIQLRAVDGLTTYATSVENPSVFTLSEDTEVKFRVTTNVGNVNGLTLRPQLELGSTATAYEPYNGDTYTTALGTTVYGGTLDVVSGELTVTDGNIASYNGETLPSTWISDRDVYASGTTPTTGAQVVYKLATPTTTTLTAQQIDLLLGTNNIWADTGDVTLEYGQNPNVIINPTLFDASPLLEVEGYGTIGFNGYEIELENVELGEVQISTAHNHISFATVTLDTQLLNNSDAIYTQDKMLVRQNLKVSTGYNARITNAIVTSTTNATEATAKPTSHGQYLEMSFRADWGDGFVYGTSKTVTSTVTITASVHAGGTHSATITISFVTAYNGTDRVTCTKSVTWTGTGGNYLINMTTPSTIPVFYGDSSDSALGHPTYIDCDLGECYLINGGEIVSLNQHIDLGSQLPTLASGANTITYDNTITELKVQPRWWKV